MSNKRKLEEHEMVALTKECSAAIQNKFPGKLKDPNSFSIPWLLGNVPIKLWFVQSRIKHKLDDPFSV